MPRKQTLLEKETQLCAALNDPSVTCVSTLAKKLGLGRSTTYKWLLDSPTAQQKLSQNKKARRIKQIKKVVDEVDSIAATGIALYRATAIVGVYSRTYRAYKSELSNG